jgi:flagellin-like hook-associated protein FlgL
MSFKIDASNVQYTSNTKKTIEDSINKISSQLREGGISKNEVDKLANNLDNKAKGFENEIKQQVASTPNYESDDILKVLKSLATSQTNAKAAESQLRDVDFNKEVQDFKKDNILSQDGDYRQSQSLENDRVKNLLK